MKSSFVLALAVLGLVACGDDGKHPVQPDGGDMLPKAQCDDGMDNDGDGKADYPDDPGCSTPNQDDESDDCPTGPQCAQCANGVDDDDNGATDFPTDPGCASASDNDESTPDPNACGAGLQILPLPNGGVAMGMLDATSTSSLLSGCGEGPGVPAVAFKLETTKSIVIVATTDDPNTTVDTVVDVRGEMCAMASSEIACNDDLGTDISASEVTADLAPGTYYIVVKSHDASSTGTFTLVVRTFTGEGGMCTTANDCGPGLVCNSMTCSKPQCRDGANNDTDATMDYPNDPGCDNPDDNDELDDCPDGPNCPACSNGIDDDTDNATDFPMDSSCTSASGGSESCNGERDAIVAVTGPTTMTTLVGAHDDRPYPDACSDFAGFSPGGVDRIYTVTVPATTSLTLDTVSTGLDTVIELLPTTCAEPNLVCDDDTDIDVGSSVTATNLPAGTYLLAVDLYDGSTTPTDFEIHLSGVLPVNASCEPADTLGGALACDPVNPCGGPAGMRTCQPTACSDGIDNDGDLKIDYPNEPGCTGPNDTTETDACPGAGCPQCADGADNDGDTKKDYPMDPDCTSASDTTELFDPCPSERDPVVALAGPSTATTMVGMHDDRDYEDECTSIGAFPGGLDRVFTLDVPATSSLTVGITSPSDLDTVITLLPSTCEPPKLVCDDDGQGTIAGPSLFTIDNLPAGSYRLSVDLFDDFVAPDTFTVTVGGTLASGASCEPAATLGGALTCATACVGTTPNRTCQ